MDETIAKWIIEFLLRQKIDDKIINGIISSLPIENNDFRLKKTMLLRRIETEISNGCVSEKILELIEMIEALDHENGKTVSDLMKEAYCLVAVDCTVRFLGYNVEENGKYMVVVENVWRNRVCKSEGLVSEMSKRWWEDIELAGKDESVCEKIWSRNTRNEALKAVKAYLKAEWEVLGPPFLELVGRKVGDDVEGFCRGGIGVGDGGVCSGNSLRELVAVEGSQKSPALTRRKHVAVKSKRPRGAKISDADEAVKKAGDGTSETVGAEDPTPEVDGAKEAMDSSSTKQPAAGDHHPDSVQTGHTLSPTKPTGNNKVIEAGHTGPKILESCETVKVQRALRSSTKNLRATVKDPLPEALQTAQSLQSPTTANNLETGANNPEAEKAPQTAQKPAPNTGNDAGLSKQPVTETNLPNGSNENGMGNGKKDNLKEDAQGIHKNDRKRSLMEPNETSHTLQWEDDIENSSGSPVRPRLRSPKVQKTSPLKLPEYRNVQRRRERKRWTPLEEDTLREGVLKYGRGSWKFILNDDKFAEVFHGRTEVDLKDKWRNMMKYSF